MTFRPTARYGVRTTSEPMAFTAWEFLRGAIAAWVLFLVIAPLVNVAATSLLSFVTNGSGELAAGVSPSFVVFAALLALLTFFLPWSLGALVVVGIPSAYLLGYRLRTVSATSSHLLAFAALGAAVGAATTLTAVLVMDVASMGEWAVPVAVVSNTVVTSLAVAVGWRFTARRALDADIATHIATD